MNDFHNSRERNLKRIKAFIARMPSLPTTVIKVLETCNDPKASANDLKRVISLDPVLTGRVLKLINSAYYSLSNSISSLTRAIIMLGLNTVKNLALSFTILESFNNNNSFRTFSSEEFWTHSLCVGVAAKSLAACKGLPLAGREEYFIAGLLHDLGKLPLSMQFPQEYHQAWETAQRDQDTLRHGESDLLGIDHCMVGNMIALKWHLGMTLVEALSHHHQPDNSSKINRNFVYLVSLANQFTIHLDIGTAGDLSTDSQLITYLIDKTGVAWTTLNELHATIFSEIDKAKIFLEIAQKG